MYFWVTSDSPVNNIINIFKVSCDNNVVYDKLQTYKFLSNNIE